VLPNWNRHAHHTFRVLTIVGAKSFQTNLVHRVEQRFEVGNAPISERFKVNALEPTTNVSIT
jgi:hypothetical protein